MRVFLLWFSVAYSVKLFWGDFGVSGLVSAEEWVVTGFGGAGGIGVPYAARAGPRSNGSVQGSV